MPVGGSSHSSFAATWMGFFVVAASTSGALARCTELTCSSIVEEPPFITVTNGSTGDPICDAIVIVTSPDVEEQSDAAVVITNTGFTPIEAGAPFGPLQAYPLDGGSCAYVGTALGGASNGAYTLVVEKNHFQAVRVANVRTAAESCAQSYTPETQQQVHVVLNPL